MKLQRGAAMPEFALIALLFFIVLFASIEMGRWMFVWNTLVEVTRRGARVAAVCPANHDYIQIAAVFGDPNQSAPMDSPVLPGLSTNNIVVTYYSIEQNTGNPALGEYENHETNNQNEMDLVRVMICPPPTDPDYSATQNCTPYTHNFIVPVIGNMMGLNSSPSFRTLLPMESKGDRQAAPNYCF